MKKIFTTTYLLVILALALTACAPGLSPISNTTSSASSNVAQLITIPFAISDVPDPAANAGSVSTLTVNDVTLTANESMNGAAVFTADAQTLDGDITPVGAISLTLQNASYLAGAINAANADEAVDLTIDNSSVWTVTADSYLTCLMDSNEIVGMGIGNIVANGNNVYYDRTACAALDGQIYNLIGGGVLTPVK